MQNPQYIQYIESLKVNLIRRNFIVWLRGKALRSFIYKRASAVFHLKRKIRAIYTQTKYIWRTVSA